MSFLELDDLDLSFSLSLSFERDRPSFFIAFDFVCILWLEGLYAFCSYVNSGNPAPLARTLKVRVGRTPV